MDVFSAEASTWKIRKSKTKSTSKLEMVLPGGTFTRKQPGKQGNSVSCKEVKFAAWHQFPACERLAVVPATSGCLQDPRFYKQLQEAGLD